MPNYEPPSRILGARGIHPPLEGRRVRRRRRLGRRERHPESRRLLPGRCWSRTRWGSGPPGRPRERTTGAGRRRGSPRAAFCTYWPLRVRGRKDVRRPLVLLPASCTVNATAVAQECLCLLVPLAFGFQTCFHSVARK